MRQNDNWLKLTNDSKVNLNQRSLYRNIYQTMIKHERNNYETYKTVINTWICSNPTKKRLNQSDHSAKVKLNQSPLYRNKTNSCLAFKLSLILGAICLIYTASKNSNWDQLQQVSRTQKLELTALTKCCLLLISVVEASMFGNLCKPICTKYLHFNRFSYIGWSSRKASSFNLVTKLQSGQCNLHYNQDKWLCR